ncbi:MAG: hypothetical protein KA715_10430 [Xanthomonadaceae bacterium]|nr:hypothetical protein [Xanthomonadaceae bacterium]
MKNSTGTKLHNLRIAKREWFGFIPVNSEGKRDEIQIIAYGGTHHVDIDPAHLFYEILRVRPQGIYLIHNHPSDDVRPSLSDRILTSRSEALTREFNIKFHGHYIVGPTKIIVFRNAFEEVLGDW